jgi:hypothetical protein
MNKYYYLKCGDVSIRCNKYEILLAKGHTVDSSYKECDKSVLKDIVNRIEDLVINSSFKSIIYTYYDKKHIYRDGRFCIIIFEGINTVYLKQSSGLKSDVIDKQISNVDIFLKQLESELWVS